MVHLNGNLDLDTEYLSRIWEQKCLLIEECHLSLAQKTVNRAGSPFTMLPVEVLILRIHSDLLCPEVISAYFIPKSESVFNINS